MAKTVKAAKADIFLRDIDTQSLFNNSGVLSYRYYHEWNDCYNPATDETAQIDGEVYDETSGTYKPNCPEGFSPVFNGRLSALWDNMVSCFPDRIEAMYVKMRDNGLSYKDMLTKYKDFWKYWCENLYNADAFGYANTNNFSKAYGDKVQVVDYFFGKRQRYLDSKYKCGSSVANNLVLRLYEKGRGFAIKHYQAIYCTLKWGSAFDYQRNIKPGTYSYMPFKFENPQDATFNINDADLITEISTYSKSSSGEYTIYGLEGLGNIKFDLNMGLLRRLTKFVMNYTADKPNTRENGENFDLSNMGMLRQVIVRNVKNLKNNIILSSDLLEEVDFMNTPITGVTMPPSDSLVKMVLPETITDLRLVGFPNLTDKNLTIYGYSNINVFTVEDCPQVDSYTLLKSCYDAGAPLGSVTLKGVDWVVGDLDLLLYLAKKNAVLQGKVTVSGTVSIEDKLTLMEAWGDIDKENNSLFISYNIVAVTEIAVSGKDYASKVGEYKYTLSAKPVNGNNVTSVTWEVDDNDFATIDRKTGVLTVKTVGISYTDDKVTIRVSVIKSDGVIMTATKDVRVYPRPLMLGDYVFSDGSYGAKLSDSDRSPIAVCFYIDPKGRNYALAVSLNSEGSAVWGLYNSNDANSGMSGITLTDEANKGYSVYDIASIVNIDSGLTANDANMRDESNEANDGFKEYSVLNTISDIGFQTVTSTIYNELRAYLDRAGLRIGDKISAGQLKTLRIIKHRDTILKDGNVNLPVPTATDEQTEAQSLLECINSITSSKGSKYQQYYYPAASQCFAYKPSGLQKGEVLDESVGANHWFLPSVGELERMSWHLQKGFTFGSEHAIFSQAYTDGKFVNPGSNWHWSASEYSALYSWYQNPSSGQVLNGNYKSNSYVVRPVLAFRLKA